MSPPGGLPCPRVPLTGFPVSPCRGPPCPRVPLTGSPVSQLAQKYDPQRERELRAWIEGMTGRRIGDSFMDGLKDGVILCEYDPRIPPGSSAPS